MQTALRNFLAQVKSIERTIDLRDGLVDLGLQRPMTLSPSAVKLRESVRRTGQSGLQPLLDGSVLLLAAAFEQFISDVMIAFTDDLPAIVPVYMDLPRSIRRSNERLTGEALHSSRNRFEDSDLRIFVANLRNCQTGNVPYVLNGQAIALNHHNVTSRNLNDLFTRIGVRDVWAMVSSTRTLKYWSGPGGTRVTRTLAQNLLNELMDSRNDIAHRVGTSKPGPPVIHSYIRFQRALARALVKGLDRHATSL